MIAIDDRAWDLNEFHVLIAPPGQILGMQLGLRLLADSLQFKISHIYHTTNARATAFAPCGLPARQPAGRSCCHRWIQLASRGDSRGVALRASGTSARQELAIPDYGRDHPDAVGVGNLILIDA